MPVNLSQLVYAVVAGSGYDLGTCSLYLLGLHCGRLKPPISVFAHRESATTPTAAEVIPPTGSQIYEIHYAVLQY